jgi:ParB family chromosome partitioning protein
MGHARALLGLTQRRHQIEVGTLVAKKGLSVRETEALVRSMLAKAAGGTAPARDSKTLDPNVRRLQDELSEKLGAPVHIEHTGSGKGKVLISYHSLDELDGILAHIH